MRKDKSFQVGGKSFKLSLVKGRVVKAREFSRTHVSGDGGGNNTSIDIRTTHTDHQEYWVEPVDGGPEEHLDYELALLSAREGHVIHHLSFVSIDGRRIPLAMHNENTGQEKIMPLDFIRSRAGMNGSGSSFGFICFIAGLIGAGIIWFATELPWWFAVQVAVGGWLVQAADQSKYRRMLGRKEFEHLYRNLLEHIQQDDLKGLYRGELFP